MRNWLAFVGRRYSGKDYCGNIVMSLDPRFERRAFADIPKQEFCDLNGLTMEEFIEAKERYRPLFSDFCEMKKEKHGKDFWSKANLSTMDKDRNYVITDLRFMEELIDVLPNTVIYRIHSEPDVRKRRGWVVSDIDNHISETEMDLCSHTFYTLTGGGGIFNNEIGTDNILKGQIYKILNKHFSNILV